MRYPLDPTETKWLIGQEWKFSNGRSGLILIGRKFDQEWLSKREFLRIEVVRECYSVLKVRARGGTQRGKEPNKSGDNDGEDPPVPMPNTVVKLSDADDSQLATARENMSLPDTKRKPARRIVARVFLLSAARAFLLSAGRAFRLPTGSESGRPADAENCRFYYPFISGVVNSLCAAADPALRKPRT